jgi:hypothetical protein
MNKLRTIILSMLMCVVFSSDAQIGKPGVHTIGLNGSTTLVPGVVTPLLNEDGIQHLKNEDGNDLLNEN